MLSCYQRFASISAHGLISLWLIRCLRMGKIDVITYKYVIIKYYNECLIKELDTSKNCGNPTFKNTRFDKSQVIHSIE